MKTIRINVFNEGIKLPYKKISSSKIKSIAFQVVNVLDLQNISLSIIVSDNKYIQEINNKYRNENRPTDVISFSNRETPFPAHNFKTENIGDIFISIEKASEQSMTYDVSINDEFSRLLIHGILHLLGFSHELSEKERIMMIAKENDILKQINIR